METMSFFKRFRPLLLGCLASENLILPKQRPKYKFKEVQGKAICDKFDMKDNTNFRVVINFSSQSNHHMGLRKQKRENPRLRLFHNDKLDLKLFDRCVLFHGTDMWHGLWATKKIRPKYYRTVGLEKWTLFATKKAPQHNRCNYPKSVNLVI